MNYPRNAIENGVAILVMALSLVTVALILLLPSESLVVDLVYQGF